MSIAMLALGTIGTLAVAHSRMRNFVYRTNDSLAHVEDLGKITILMPTLNESAFIEQALTSLRNQNIVLAYPEYFEIVVADSESDDGTVDIAKNLADRVITVPMGKLTAIDEALREVNGDVVIATDGDTFYPPNFINLLLKRFDPNIVAVTGVELKEDNILLNLRDLYLQTHIVNNVDLSDLFPKHQRMMGRGCAYRRWAYFATGGFDLSINQKDVESMQWEEEWGFWKRLKQVGTCIREDRAVVRTTSRRESCMVSQDSYCQQIASGAKILIPLIRKIRVRNNVRS